MARPRAGPFRLRPPPPPPPPVICLSRDVTELVGGDEADLSGRIPPVEQRVPDDHAGRGADSHRLGVRLVVVRRSQLTGRAADPLLALLPATSMATSLLLGWAVRTSKPLSEPKPLWGTSENICTF